MPDIRPPFEPPLLPSTLRFGSDPNLSQQGSNPLLDPLAAHRKMMGLRPAGFQPTSTGKQLSLLLLLILWSHLSSPLLASPSLYEMAALTSELDTAVITSKVKEILLQHNVGQKVRKESLVVVAIPPFTPPKPYQNYSKSSIVVGVNVNLLVCFFIEMLTLRT